MSVAAPDGSRGQAGFALLMMLGVIGVGSLGLLLVVQRFLPPLADVGLRAQNNLDATASALRDVFVRTGAFPSNLDALATAAGLPRNGAWRIDPMGDGQDLDYRVLSTGVQLSSRGPDRRLRTGDDVVVDVGAEDLLRVRQRARLRLIRATLLRSPVRHSSTMSAGDEASMRSAMRDYAISQRSMLTATSAERTVLAAKMTAAQTTVSNLATANGCTAMPAAVRGAGGLMQLLQMPDSRAYDGAGRALRIQATMGVLAIGNDRQGGTDDDM